MARGERMNLYTICYASDVSYAAQVLGRYGRITRTTVWQHVSTYVPATGGFPNEQG